MPEWSPWWAISTGSATFPWLPFLVVEPTCGGFRLWLFWNFHREPRHRRLLSIGNRRAN